MSSQETVLTSSSFAHSNARLEREQQLQEVTSTSAKSNASPSFLPDTPGAVSASNGPSRESGPPPAKPSPTVYHSWYDTEWGPTKVRLHTFLTGREASGAKPVAGLTASIILEVATIGYGREPVGFEVDAFGQANRRERIAYAINRVKKLQEAAQREKVQWDWEREERTERAKSGERLERLEGRSGRSGLGTGDTGGIIKSRL